ncbi:DUF6432 family protein [Natrialbaceae archaeon AArc-T1-2]|uniref:DUF6432 family protein n=1 Tax=Natrialbaceae archaeon AArc-T1-2 TaxID=3053904 RepID=UPI00255AE6A3|nr:DUF6432 family protein [Natrialbaceae archaeon AArc-T1-2]WIV66283.1 DUF6432 family protein [Natrialbaceae archaeon AArc-T1-2]
MRAKREYRNRSDTEVAVLDALVNRADDGMTVFELRAAVSTEIDDLETALERLKDDGLIEVESNDGRTVIKPDERVIPDAPATDEDESLVEWLRERIPF